MKIEGAPSQIATTPAKNQKVEEVAQLYEKQFMREMVKAMRKSVSESEFMQPTMAEKIYREQLDEQYVESWGDKGGVGLADLIYKDIMEKLVEPRSRRNMASIKGPLPLSDRDILRVEKKVQAPEQESHLKVELAASQQPATVRTPWSGQVVSRFRLSDSDMHAVVLDHPTGLQSTFLLNGTASALEPGQKLDAGATLGVLSPEIRSFFWNIKQGAGIPEGQQNLSAGDVSL